MTTNPSPLGRYEPGAPEPATVEVRLLNLPLQILVDLREHHDGVMREFRLMALDGSVSTQAAPARLLELVQVLGVQFAGSSTRPDEEIDAALDRGELTLDVTYVVPPAAADAARALDELMNDADDYCRSEQLLTLARTPLMTSFAGWYLSCFVDQIAGAAPEPWTGPLTP